MLTCKECGEKVQRVDGAPVRSCGHDNAAIVANLTAKVSGRGGMMRVPRVAR
jgi:hypothetical protein